MLGETVRDTLRSFKSLDMGDVVGTPTFGVTIIPDDDRVNYIMSNNTTLNSFTGANALGRDNFEENTPGTPYSPVSHVFAFSLPNTLSPKTEPPTPEFKIPSLMSIP